MATKRKPIHGSHGLKFRPSMSETKTETKGTKPTTNQSSVKEVFAIMVMHLCKKSLFFDTNLKVALYLGCLFLVSLIADVMPIPKGYLSRSDNILNQYFVKFAWGWNLLLLMPYTILTSFVYCCGDKQKIIKHHLVRIFIATMFWWTWTTAFNIIESTLGRCSMKGEVYNSKQKCLKDGYLWNGFDVSGHCFILIYGSLVLIEECRSIINWDSIKDYIRLEDHKRSTRSNSEDNNILKNLSPPQFQLLKFSYDKYTPYIRGLFVGITLLQILWDVMLVGTIVYYHIMIEKFLGGAVAILTWFFTYKFWYPSSFLPRLPGDGVFKYNKPKSAPVVSRKRTGSIINGQPTFMGRPLKTDTNVDNKDDIVR